MKTTEAEHICGLKRENFQTTIKDKSTYLYFLTNNAGNVVAITNYGGALVAIMVPDKDGNLANVIQGHDNIQDVINSPEPYLSTLIGRYGNRICKGRFQLKGKEYQLPINNGPNSLHGGKSGFNAKVWEALQMNDHTLVLKYVSPYGEEGFSGEMRITVVYSFSDDNELSIEYMATTNKKTVVNLTSHGFFSLAGIANPTPTIDNLVCEINADFYLPIDDTSIPTGEIRFVKGTPFDFRSPKAVGRDIDADDEQIKHLGCALQEHLERCRLRPLLRSQQERRGRTELCSPHNRTCERTHNGGLHHRTRSTGIYRQLGRRLQRPERSHIPAPQCHLLRGSALPRLS